MKILITGSTGFIGKWLITLLNDQGYTPYLFLNDITHPISYPMKNFDIIIHLAALITHKKKYSLKEFYKTNFIGTRNLINFFNKSKIIYISTKDVTHSNLTSYAKSKLDAEKIVLKNKNNLVIRFPSIFGPNMTQKKLIPLLFEKYCYNKKCKIFNNQEREYLFVKDAAQSIIDSFYKNGIINIQGYKIRNKELSKMIKSICEKKNIENIRGKKKLFFNQLKECLPDS